MKKKTYSFNFDIFKNNSITTKKHKGASIPLQKQWKSFSIPQRTVNKILHKDTDRDGVPDRWDCQPRNPWKQDSKPNKLIKQRIDRLPVFMVTMKTDDKGDVWSKGTNLKDKSKYKTERNTVYHMFKKYPNLITDVEDINTDQNTDVYFTTDYDSYKVTNINRKVPATGQYIKKEKLDGNNNLVFTNLRTNKNKNINISDKAITTFHEIKHAKQYNNMTDEEYKDAHTPYKNKTYNTYFENPYEKEAEDYAIDKAVAIKHWQNPELNKVTDAYKDLNTAYKKDEKQKLETFKNIRDNYHKNIFPQKKEEITEQLFNSLDNKPMEQYVQQEHSFQKDTDGDGYVDGIDCEPNNPEKQAQIHNINQQQTYLTLFNTSDIPPSQFLKENGKVWGFSSYDIAKKYKQYRNKKYVYQFLTDKYILDKPEFNYPQSRQLDNEYIAFNVLQEKRIE